MLQNLSSVQCLQICPRQHTYNSSGHQQRHKATSPRTRLPQRQRYHVLNRQQPSLRASAVEAPAVEDAEPERPAGVAEETEVSTSGNDEDIPIETKLGITVQVKNLVKDYKVKGNLFRAVDDVTVEFPANKIIALLGPSGSGKTTLLRLIAGLESVTDGHIYFGDVDATDIRVQDRQIGMVFQGYALFKHMTVAENISFGPRIQDLDVDEEERVTALLDMVELPGYEQHKPAQLSGGQKQRVALARALACNPQLLLLDEPFGALDPEVRATLRDSVRDIIYKVGVTSILVTHDQDEAFGIADKVVIFNRGRIEQEGTPTEIICNPATPFVLDFIADVNHLPTSCQFVKRTGLTTEKSHVMIKPSVISMKEAPEGRSTTPATIVDKLNIGWLIKYFLVFDDDVKFEVHVKREDDAKLYSNLDVKGRVHVQATAAEMMPFNLIELDSAPM